jgi:acyl transferase domain-containing protein
MREALRKAGAEPSAIGYIEAHGTGTPLGDAMELDSIRSVFRGLDSPGNPIVVGSVKTNIGHLESAAGIAGLIKAVLVLQHEEIPPHLHWKRGHADRVEIPASGKCWQRGAEKRLAGVSSFGFGGTNAHIILEEAPVREAAGTAERPVHIVALSAKTPAALEQIAARYAEFLRENPGVSIGDFAHTVNCGRPHFGVRRAVVANSVEDLRAKLAARAEARMPAGPPRVAFLYTGQGSQYDGMGRELYESQPVFHETLDRCAAVLRPLLENPLLDVIFASSLLDETAYTQPALFALEMALTELWKSWGVRPSIVLGHSVGEYAAACAAGVFSLEEGLKLIAARGRLMQQLPRNGTMVSVFAEEERVAKAAARYADSVSMAAINGPRLVVLSGESKAIDAIIADLAKAGVSTARLTVSHAFHSPLMRPMLAEFERETKDVRFRPPSTPLISNVSGAVAGEEVARPEYWSGHVLAPVRFHAAMESLDAAGADVLVEIGPKPMLLTMGKRCLPARERAWLASLESGRANWQTLLETLGELYTRGCDVNWEAIDAGFAHKRISGIPTYPFQRERYWVDRVLTTEEAAHPLLGRRLERLAHLPGTRVWQGRMRGNLEFIEDHRLLGSSVLPYSAYVEMALAAVAESAGEAAYEIADLKLHQPIFFGENGSAEVQSILTEQPAGFSFQVFRRQGPSDSAWLLCASARLRLAERRLPDEVRADVLCRQ